jgi:hypothetical protein
MCFTSIFNIPCSFRQSSNYVAKRFDGAAMASKLYRQGF